MIKKDRIVIILNIGVILLFALLLYKDPFSQRSLIPNFEPYPDTFHYINPALSLIQGKGFSLYRESRALQPNVAPLYSLSLITAFLLKADPRMAYYSNVFLAFVSLTLFWLIVRKILNNKFIIFCLLVLYTTNYFIYWVPSLVMAENLTLTLYLAAVYFLLLKTTKVSVFMVAIFAVGSYATKYANMPIVVAITTIFLGKIIFDNLTAKQKIKQALFFLLALGSFFLVLAVFEGLSKGNNILSEIFRHILTIYSSVPKTDGAEKAAATASWFGIQYIGHNLPLYIKSLLGQHNRFLWDNTPIISSFVGIGGILGILISLFRKNLRFIALTLLLFIFLLVAFISSFYSFDARYIYISIPSLIIGLGLFLAFLKDKVLKDKLFFNLLVVAFIGIYLISSIIRIKGQISLNLRYSETPWNYIAVLKMNEYFAAERIKDSKKPVLISALPPFLIDYYSNGNYTLLPLSYEQEFRGQAIREIVWGPNDYANLPKLYSKYLNEGYDMYVSRAGLGNEGYTNRDFNTIVKVFDTRLVLQGCYDQCNIYSVKLKNKNGN